MKKFKLSLIAVLAVLVSITFLSCGKPKPEKVASEYFISFINQDYDTVYDLICEKNKAGLDKEGFVQTCKQNMGQMAYVMKVIGENTRINEATAQITDNTAIVSLDIDTVASDDQEFAALVIQTVIESLSLEDENAIMENIREELKDAKIPRAKELRSINLILEDGNWKIN